ncbi:DUF2062 domain-containing protein [Gloeocapsa sp. PCC 73106]|uniref:DUF2062 domain-containing protein n=1 Tax=Gloeocapsa sp. PCC 73106 TaxID=102232 RepID=UPI0002ABC0A1|nr:DUF2062 domain-containing protein [Gloeocapsa sp. PCC 73106]ELR98881.1 hypothetical protein GLO73106DRAFT_00027190 [Gloeocapsa sp. PCC 73106]
MSNPRELNLFTPRQRQSKWLRRIRYYYLRLLRLEGSPKVIARGLACGVFAGCFPWLGLQTIIGVILAIFLRGNKLAAALGTWISNPLTYAPIFLFNFKIGELVQGSSSVDLSQFNWKSDWTQLVDLGQSVLITLFIGSFCVGLVTAILVYFVSLRLIEQRKKRF